MKAEIRFITIAAFWLLPAALSDAAVAEGDWPQFQQNEARTGYTQDCCKPPYRARWIWFGPEHVLRNKESRKNDPQWTDDLSSGPGKCYRMPQSVPFCFGGSMQPLYAGGRLFAGDSQGKLYALNPDDGATLWTADNPGGSLWPGVATDKVVVFPSLEGFLTAYDAASGKRLWQLDTGKAITTAPALLDGVLYAASQSGHVYAVQIADGKLLWESAWLGALIQGGLCVANGRVYTGTEALEAIALDLKTGQATARRKLVGQSFRLVWPVAVKDRVIFTTAATICVGSEYVNDGLLAGKPGQQVGWVKDAKSGYADAKAEEEAMRQWLSGSGRLWETCFSLKADTLEKDYSVATGATEGCGMPPDPPVIDGEGRPLLWWASAYGSVIPKCGFGTSYTMDLSSFDLTTGRRVMLSLEKKPGQTTESDNLYALSAGGNYLYFRQSFRGTSAMDLTSGAGFPISAIYRVHDGGTWQRPINYADNGDKNGVVLVPSTPKATEGRCAPTIAGSRLFFTEHFCITCVETRQE